MDELTAPAETTSVFGRLRRGYLQLSVRRMVNIKVEDMALAGGYFAAFWLLDAVNLSTAGDLRVPALASAWAALAVLGCAGVLLRRVYPTAMAWMCGVAVVGLALAGHAGAFVLAFEFFFSLVLFATPRASQLAARAAWVLTVVLVLAAFIVSQSASTTIAAALIAVVTLLTPVEWAGNLRKAHLLADSESARADALQDAAEQRLLAERSAHDLALEHERQHMARELHDVVSARLSAITLQSGAALHMSANPSSTLTGPVPPGTIPSRTIPSGAALLHQIRDESVAGLEELNSMIRLLHTGVLAEAGGQISDLNGLLRQYRNAGMELRYSNSLDDAGESLTLPLQAAIYRVAAEAVSNAAKHAPGQSVDVVLAAESVSCAGPGAPEVSPSVVLAVSNPLPHTGQKTSAVPASGRDSTQLMPPSSTGTGIPSMHFRAAHAGGTLTAQPVAGLWKVALRLPLSAPHAATPLADAPTQPAPAQPAPAQPAPAQPTGSPAINSHEEGQA